MTIAVQNGQEVFRASLGDNFSMGRIQSVTSRTPVTDYCRFNGHTAIWPELRLFNFSNVSENDSLYMVQILAAAGQSNDT